MRELNFQRHQLAVGRVGTWEVDVFELLLKLLVADGKILLEADFQRGFLRTEGGEERRGDAQVAGLHERHASFENLHGDASFAVIRPDGESVRVQIIIHVVMVEHVELAVDKRVRRSHRLEDFVVALKIKKSCQQVRNHLKIHLKARVDAFRLHAQSVQRYKLAILFLEASERHFLPQHEAIERHQSRLRNFNRPLKRFVFCVIFYHELRRFLDFVLR